jgi:cysteine desulfurase
VELLPVTADGRLDLDILAARLAAWDAADGRPFIALMLVNNEMWRTLAIIQSRRGK